ncbi:unnamed protein product [Rotaria magnacalcarata]|uniref:Uncharacterized protein n=4 Tax=Rotaria magnacalcarata TaxID=392030 RepID=A0A814KT39_9BILA|nr:unnamed protein product [Rotaria magnacalcarata]
MDSVEKIISLMPKFKYQLLFLKEREKLFSQNNGDLVQTLDSSSVSQNLNVSSSSSTSVSDHASKSLTDSVTSVSDSSLSGSEVTELFPNKYTIPSLPNGLLKDVQDGALAKFGPHCSNRQILIECIVNDLINKYRKECEVASIKDVKNWLPIHYKLYFLCECSHEPTRMHVAPRGGYSIKNSKQFIRRYESYLRPTLKIAQLLLSAGNLAIPQLENVSIANNNTVPLEMNTP